MIGLLPSGDDIAALQPLQDRVLIEVVVAADQTAGGVLLTDGAKEKPTMGRVVAVRLLVKPRTFARALPAGQGHPGMVRRMNRTRCHPSARGAGRWCGIKSTARPAC